MRSENRKALWKDRLSRKTEAVSYLEVEVQEIWLKRHQELVDTNEKVISIYWYFEPNKIVHLSWAVEKMKISTPP